MKQKNFTEGKIYSEINAFGEEEQWQYIYRNGEIVAWKEMITRLSFIPEIIADRVVFSLGQAKTLPTKKHGNGRNSWMSCGGTKFLGKVIVEGESYYLHFSCQANFERWYLKHEEELKQFFAREQTA